MVLAQRGLPSLGLIVATLVGGDRAGSANAINCYLDRDIDEVMRRTRKRPLPAHLVEPDSALAFGFVLGAISFFFLSIAVNVLAASLALSAIAFYVFVYTMWLKRTSVQNIVIGGAAGAVPALVGWAAVTGTVGLAAWVLFAIVFVWTPPHFWALAMRYSGDYRAAGIPMLPVVRGPQETRKQILLYSLVLFGTSLLLVPVASMGLVVRRRGRPARRLVRVARAPPVARDLAGRVDAPVPLLDRLPRPAVRRGRGRRAHRLFQPEAPDLPHTPVAPCDHLVTSGGGPDDRVPGRAVRRRRRGIVPGDVAPDAVPRQRRREREFLGSCPPAS